MSARRSGDPHAQLMREMNTPIEDGYDPMPARQHGYLLDIREPMKNRAIAWVWSKTLHPGKGRQRSAYVRDGREKAKDAHLLAAKELGWTSSNALTVFRQLQGEGRIEIDEEGGIWVRGDAPEPVLAQPKNNRRKKGEQIDAQNMYIFLPERLRLHFQSLEKNHREREAAEYFRMLELKNKVVADAIAAARDLAEKIDTEWHAAKGCPPENENRGRPKKDREALSVQLSLLQAPDFVHISNGKYERKPVEASEQKKNGFVQNGNLYKTESEYRESSSSVIRDALADYGTADDDAAETLLEKCQAKAREATAADVVRVIHEKGPITQRRTGKVENPIGFLLTAVPKVFESWQPPPRETPAATAAAPSLSIDEQIATLEALLHERPDRSDAAILRAELEQLRETLATTEAPQQC